MRRGLVLSVLLVWAGPVAASAASMAEGNDLYSQGKFEQARDAYAAVVKSGVESEELYYNLGNAYFRVGELGAAIYNYERALRLDPDMGDARYNLEVVRSAVGERVRDRLKGAEREERWVRAARAFTISELTVALLALNGLLFSLLVVLRFLSSGFNRSVLRVVTGFVAVTTLVCGALFAGNVYLLERVQEGIVLPEQAPLREGNSQETAERGQVHAGLKVRVIENRGDWSRVRLSNGVEGWLPRRSLGQL